MPTKQRATKTIEAVRLLQPAEGDGQRLRLERNCEVWSQAVAEFFKKKWQSEEHEFAEEESDMRPPNTKDEHWCTTEEVANVLSSWRRQDLTDAYGVSMWNAGDSAAMATRPRGYMCGKSTATPSLAEIRCILPLTTFMSFIDRLLANTLHTWADQLAEQLPKPECFEGARPRTQILDFTHATSLGIERGLDSHGNFGVSSSDIRQYLELRKLPKFFAEAVVRAQAHPTLENSCGHETIYVHPTQV